MILDGFWVACRDGSHGGEVAFDALLLEGGLVEVGVGADEEAGAAFDGGAEGFKVTAGFGGDEEEGLLGVGGDGDGGAFRGVLLVPGVDLGEPVIGRLVGGAAEEGDDEEEVVGLVVGEVGFDPEFVAGLEVGDLGDGEGFVAAGDFDLDFGAGEVEAGVVGAEGGCGGEQGEEAGEDVRGLHSGLDAGVGWGVAGGVIGRGLPLWVFWCKVFKEEALALDFTTKVVGGPALRNRDPGVPGVVPGCMDQGQFWCAGRAADESVELVVEPGLLALAVARRTRHSRYL